jgi:L-aspartate oxidase
MKVQYADILIIGSGIAGLSFAIKLLRENPELRIVMATKGEVEEGSTRYAQGGIAVVLDQLRDNFESHIQDTLAASGGFADPQIVEMVVRQAPERLHELEEWGAHFDKNRKGKPDLALEGGHSVPRVVHARDSTGKEVARSLSAAALRFPQLEILSHHFAIDLHIYGDTPRCGGAWLLSPQGDAFPVIAPITLLATGGCGQLFSATTNPLIATGDGVAAAIRAHIPVLDLHTLQFHPTALYLPGKQPSFLLTEALRGFGAYVVNHDQERFLFATDPRGELATRDIVTRAIWKELSASGADNVFIDARHLDPKALEKAFPTVVAYCRLAGFDPTRVRVPVAPAAHYQCGGIYTDAHGRTIMPGLFAAGECASTGMHGRNRLASNSLLEALVFAHRAAKYILSHPPLLQAPSIPKSPLYMESGAPPIATIRIRKQLQQMMTNFYMGILDATEIIALASTQLHEFEMHLPNDVASLELRNLCVLALGVIENAESGEIFTNEKRRELALHTEKFWN